MSSSTTATRRPRSSMGPIGTSVGEATTNQPVIDIEFRRRHSRQNKDIIMENVQHKLQTKILRDEITSLKEELLEVKHSNRILSARISSLQKSRMSSETSAGLAAIDLLLGAMPALQQLRNDLCAASAESLPPIPYETTRANLLRNMGMSIATKPAASGSRMRGLDTLGEEADFSEPLSDVELASRLGQSSSRPSPLAKAAGRSPAALKLRHPPPPTFVIDSPSSSSASPSPRKRVVPSPKRKPRRRRESGLMPATASHSPSRLSESSSLSELETEASRQVSDSAEIYEDVADDTQAITPTCSTPVVQTTSAPSSSSTSSSLTSLDSSSDSAPSVPAYTVSPATAAAIAQAEAEDDGRRHRRARGSINYKEPSLTKKMRKPDGVAVSDMLRHRQSLDVMPEMVLPRQGMRRKSVLPKSMGKLPSSSLLTTEDDDDDDADDIDDCLLAVPDEDDAVESGPSVTSYGSSSTPSSSSSSALTPPSNMVDTERTPTPIPPIKAAASASESTTQAAVNDAAPPTRISPRKPALPPSMSGRRPSALATKVLPRRIITPTERARSALADVPGPNLPKKTAKQVPATKRISSAPTAKWK